MNALLFAVSLFAYDGALDTREYDLLIAQADEREGDPRIDRLHERRERALEVIETVRIAKLTEALQLDPKTAEKFFPAIRPFNERRGETGRKRMEAMLVLRQELDREKPDEKKVSEQLDLVVETQREMAKIQEDEYAALKKVLDPVTLARYYRFQLEFDREVKGILKDFKAEKAGKAGRFRDRP